MRWAWMSAMASVLVLCGCKATDKKSPDREAPGMAASRTKDKDKRGPTWLEEMKNNLPGSGGPVPKADSWADASDPNIDIAREVRGVLGGVVVDPDGYRAGNVTIQIEPAESLGSSGAPMSIVADSQGYFLTKGLKAGQSYTLLVRAESEGRAMIAVQQSRVPNPNLTIKLRDDIHPLSRISGEGSRVIPPPAAEFGPGPTVTSENNRDPPPPADLGPAKNDGSWAPGGSTTAPLHKVLPSTAPAPAPTVRPESITGAPKPDWPPAASLPTPPLPTLPPPISPAPAPIAPGKPRFSSNRSGASIALVDTLDRPWTFQDRSGRIVLVDFMTTTCGPCKQSIPTLVALQSRYGAYGLQVIAVACDEKPRAERAALAAKYTRDFNLNYALYVEPGSEPGSVRDPLNVEKYPTAILFDAAGNEVWRGHPNDGAKLESAIRQHLSAR